MNINGSEAQIMEYIDEDQDEDQQLDFVNIDNKDRENISP